MSGLALGRVLAAGTDVSNAKVGDRVLLPLYSHTWRERVVVPSNGLVFLPPEADVQQLAMLRINPPPPSSCLVSTRTSIRVTRN